MNLYKWIIFLDIVFKRNFEAIKVTSFFFLVRGSILKNLAARGISCFHTPEKKLAPSINVFFLNSICFYTVLFNHFDAPCVELSVSFQSLTSNVSKLDFSISCFCSYFFEVQSFCGDFTK